MISQDEMWNILRSAQTCFATVEYGLVDKSTISFSLKEYWCTFNDQVSFKALDGMFDLKYKDILSMKFY